MNEKTNSEKVGDSFSPTIVRATLNKIEGEIGKDLFKLEYLSDMIHDAILRYEADPRTTEMELERLYCLRKKCAKVQFNIQNGR
jgi:hypothetical protein